MKAVIFDMDGVIIDSEPIHDRLMLATLAHFGIPFDPQDLTKFVGTTTSFLFETLKQEHRLKISVEEMNTYHYGTLFHTIRTENLAPIPGILELLSEIQRRQLMAAIASSSALELIQLITQKFSIAQYFEHLTSGEDLPKSKPDPAIYLLTAQKLNVAPADCLVIEDAHLGVAAAKAAGMTCIGFQNPHSGQQDLSAADEIVHSIAEIDLQKYL